MSEPNFHNVEQRSEEWLRLRLGKITGTRLKDVFKSNNLTLVDELISEMLTEQIEENYVNDAMQRGIDLEPLAIEAYEAETSSAVYPVGFVTNDDLPMCGLSPDGFVEGNGAVEIKCPSSKKHIEYIRTNRVPAEYKYQIQMYFLINPEIKHVDFVSYDPRVALKPLHIVKVERSDIAEELEETRKGLLKFVDKVRKYYDDITF